MSCRLPRRVVALAPALLTVDLAAAHAQIALNEWNVAFDDAMVRRDVPEFLRQLQVFAEALSPRIPHPERMPAPAPAWAPSRRFPGL